MLSTRTSLLSRPLAVAVASLALHLFIASPALAGIHPPGSAPTLARGEGYALFFIEVGGVAPSFSFRRLGRLARWQKTGDIGNLPRGPVVRTPLKSVEPGFYLMPLPAGVYQITVVEAPFFDLPFKLVTEEKPGWRFTIADGKTNYVGTLHIGRKRSRDSVDIVLLNQLAMHCDPIGRELQEILSSAPLRDGAFYQDDFFEEIMQGSCS